MSFFKKALSSIGIGSAKVDTVLLQDQVQPGGVLRGRVEVNGGGIEQQIETIYLQVKTKYEIEKNDAKSHVDAVLGEYALTAPFSIKTGEHREFPFELVMPLTIPLSIGHTTIWIQTGLDIKQAVDPTDTDHLHVTADALQITVLNALEQLGLRLHEAKCVEAPHHLRLPCVQEFEFVPQHGSFRGRLDEVELVFVPQGPNQVDLYLEVDRRKRGLSGFLAEAMDLDETRLRVSVFRGQQDIPQMLAQAINRFS
ncbi:MAG: hypothetical protein A2511_08405 [Deltaproteobacteria bacterium RIFOXYD12_FULL_50_9]|nr:MAG: hypothetical protein A2511_08405 [Deltaproteobacteria bacterium RIFOXYD12_FULL_50_9]